MSSAVNQEMSKLSKLNYMAQAHWFCNGFYNDVEKDMEKIWDYIKHFIALDKLGPTKKGEEGNELDAFWSAKFLEDKDKALPALERKAALKTIDQDNNGCMSLLEYLSWKYDKKPDMVANAPQGDNQAAVAKAAAKMAEVERALAQVIAALERLKAQQERLAAEEVELAKLKAELEAAIAALKAEQDAFDNKLAGLEAIANNPDASTVKKSKASNEVAQMKAEDPLPLRRAKITQEAALRKVEKQEKAVKKQQEEVAAAIAESEKKQIELGKQMEEAKTELEAAKSSGSGGLGALWLMERGLYEADSYRPKSKQTYDHSKPFKFTPPEK